MNLSTSIDPRLWSSVQNAYEAGNYTAAILDSVHFLSELIRDKSGLETDGHTLIGSAFGGVNPIIKVNALHTDSDKDEQRGVEQLLRGIYTAIRNPRSHEKRSDSCEVADAIIGFVDYLRGLIDKSRSPFDKEQILTRVFDEHFVPTDQYADLLVSKIPQRKRLDVLLDIFQQRTRGRYKNIVCFAKAALRTLKREEQTAFWETVSEALEGASSDDEFRSAIQISEDDWLKVSEIARLRAEHRLVESIRNGDLNQQRELCRKGALGTWATNIIGSFTLKDEYVDAVVSRLCSDDPDARAYALKFHLESLRMLRPVPPRSLVLSLKRRLREHDVVLRDALIWIVSDDKDEGWGRELKEAVDTFEPLAPTLAIFDEDIPF